jgi:hypothetical protein
MPHTNHTIDILAEGMATSTQVQGNDTVVWQAVNASNNLNGVSSATIKFTGSNPFHPALSGSISLKGGDKSSTYTVGSATKPGKFPYTVAINGGKTYSCELQVLSGDIIILGYD